MTALPALRLTLPEALMPAALSCPLAARRWALPTEWMLAVMSRALFALIHKAPPPVVKLPPLMVTLPVLALTEALPLEPLASVTAPPLAAEMVAVAAVTRPRVMALPPAPDPPALAVILTLRPEMDPAVIRAVAE